MLLDLFRSLTADVLAACHRTRVFTCPEGVCNIVTVSWVTPGTQCNVHNSARIHTRKCLLKPFREMFITGLFGFCMSPPAPCEAARWS